MSMSIEGTMSSTMSMKGTMSMSNHFKTKAPGKKPAPKTVVKHLCTWVREETRTVITATAGNQPAKKKTFLVYLCPKECCIKGKDRELSFEQKSGYRNPYNHLVACVGGGEEDALLEVYEEAVVEQRNAAGLGNHFVARVDKPTERDQAIYGWIKLIVMKNLGLNAVEDESFRHFSKYNVALSAKTIREVILKLVELVEQSIAVELKGKKACLLHDGWSHNGDHFIGLFASYNREVGLPLKNGIVLLEPTITLLSVSPMAGLKVHEDNEDGDDSMEEFDESTTSFNAAAHVQYFSDTLSYYGIEQIADFAVSQCADNCSVNLAIARAMGIPHVNCTSHLLASEVNLMIKTDATLTGLTKTIEAVAETMKAAKNSIKNRAILRNLTSLSPQLDNKTRWSSKATMLHKFVRIREPLIEASEHENASNFPIDVTVQFQRRVEKFSNMMLEINTVTLALQKRLLKLCGCRAALELLTQNIQTNKVNPQSTFYRCKLSSVYIASDSEKLPDVHFLSGVCKIQMNQHGLMSILEKEACELLKIVPPADLEEPQPQAGLLTMAQQLKQMSNKKPRLENEYINVDFILGSAAEVERLWSICKYILTNQRKSLTPLLFEALTFLKVNHRFWDLPMVQTAIHMSRTTKLEERLAEDLAALEVEDDDE
jgi:hypothetical protein